jgi:dienelactone hydrolase/pimeloyl-ACP methyl ester carboxylesterase
MSAPDNQRSPAITRRTLLRHAVLGALGAAALPLHGAVEKAEPKTKNTKSTPTPGGGNPAGLGELAPLNRFARMMHEFWLARLVANEREAESQRAALRTRADAEAFIRARADKVRRCFGPLPEKTPLNPRITGRVEREAYVIENVIFESRPGFLVTGNLYLPKGKPLPAPGVVGVCGHSDNGKAGGSYQSFAQGLARLGYICLLIDPTGQGERIQRLTPELKPVLRWNTWEHNFVGNQQLLVGEVFGLWQAWDGIRALDYLLTRPEVNPKHRLVTGNSGGGTITTWMCALEPRLTGAAPSCFINTFRRMLESEQPADSEQCPPHTLALGLDHSDFFLPYAPRALRLLGQERDPFDARGLEQSFGYLKQLYRLIGADKNVSLFIGPDGHGYFQRNRESMYGFFNELTDTAPANAEPALTLEQDETLRCTPQGQVGAMGSRTVMSFTAEAAKALREKRRGWDGAGLRRAVADVLRLPARAGVPDYRILPAPPGRRYPKRWAGNYAVETEPGILCVTYRLSDIALVSRPPRGPKRAVLYVSDRSADAELRDEPLVRELLAEEREAAFYACDLRGIGESQPNTTNKSFTDPYGSDYFYAVYGVMFDRPYPAQRTFDLLRLVDWLQAQGHEEIHLAARGWGTVPATFAAVLDGRIRRVTLKHALTSYSEVAESDDYDWPLSAFVPEVLKHFDLPECYRALAAQGLRQIEPRGAVAPSGR